MKRPDSIPERPNASTRMSRSAVRYRRGSAVPCRTLMATMATALVLIGACAPSQTNVERDERDTATTATTATTAQTPPPVSFTLCADGLPTTGMWKCDPVFADINGDGRLDVAALPRLGEGPRVWTQQNDGTWKAASNGLQTEKRSCGGGLAVGDINHDGHADLAVGDHCHGIAVYLGDGKGNWNAVVQGLIPPLVPDDHPKIDMYRGAEDLDMADIDGDGHLDLLTGASDEGGINLFYGDGSGDRWNWSQDKLPHDGWANRVLIADVNGDGRQDIIAARGEGPRVWLQAEARNWNPASEGLPTPIVRGLYNGIALGDVNEDGRADLATANWVDGPEVYFQKADGSWVKSPDVFPDMKGGSYGLAMGDVDNDGHLDLVVSGRLDVKGGYVRGVFLLVGDGRGNWSFVSSSGLPATGLASTAGVDLADINGDGKLDVVAGSGLIVETAPGPTEPVIPERLPVWCSMHGGTRPAD